MLLILCLQLPNARLMCRACVLVCMQVLPAGKAKSSASSRLWRRRCLLDFIGWAVCLTPSQCIGLCCAEI